MFSMKILIACLLLSMLNQSIAETRSFMFLKRRDGYCMKQSDVMEAHEMVGDLMSCLALCNQDLYCNSASYKSADRLCHLTQLHFSFTMVAKSLIDEPGWTTMTKRNYPVYLGESPLGAYELTYDEGVSLCKSEGSEIATRGDLIEAYKAGMSVCACGWLADRTNGFIINSFSVEKCSLSSTPGKITTCASSMDKSNVWCQLK